MGMYIFPPQDGYGSVSIQANTKVSCIHQEDRCLYLLLVGVDGRGDGAIGPNSTTTQKKMEELRRVLSSLSEEVLFIRVRGGRGSIYHGHVLAQCSVCRAAGDAVKAPASLTCRNQPTNERGKSCD